MEAIRELEAEHRGIERMLAIMQGVGDRMSAAEQVDPRHLEQIGEFIRIFADRCHHAKEEDLLFPAMERAGIPRQDGPIGVMLVEHSTGRAFVARMLQATAAYRAGELEGASEWVKNALGYISLLRPHIAKEDQILYPMAERVLSADQDRVLVEGFERIEAEQVGPGRHEAFHHLLDELGQIYATHPQTAG